MTYTLTEAREELAAELSLLDGVNIRPSPPVKNPRPGDGWVVVSRVVPGDFTRSWATLTVVIVLGSDVAYAEELLNTYAVDLIDAATRIDELPASDVAFEPAQLQVDNGFINGATLTLSTEVES